MSERRIVERVLIVDDDEAVANGLTALFECLNITTRRVYLASFALRAIALHVPDLVIVDIGLPEIDGRALALHIRANSDVPIVLVSGHVPSLHAVPPRAVFLQKPFSLEDLDRSIHLLGLTISARS